MMRMEPAVCWTLIAASVLIAAGGYIINDYFDLNIDRVNRPEKLVVERVIKRRWAMAWHIIFSLAGLLLSFYVGYRLGNPLIGLLNLAVVILLWFYSTTFKKQLLIGNIIISLLTAWVVLILYVCEMRFDLHRLSSEQVDYLSSVLKASVLYGGFAFIISLVREVVKDMEDLEGDTRYHCRTMPIVWGIPVSRAFAYTWMIVLGGAVLILTVYTVQINWWWMAAYLCMAVLIPLVQVFRKLGISTSPRDFGMVSRLLKWIMLTGILSMAFYKLYL
jgi:4-hydroxybenzoate polyprenyltransferase